MQTSEPVLLNLNKEPRLPVYSLKAQAAALTFPGSACHKLYESTEALCCILIEPELREVNLSLRTLRSSLTMRKQLPWTNRSRHDNGDFAFKLLLVFVTCTD